MRNTHTQTHTHRDRNTQTHRERERERESFINIINVPRVQADQSTGSSIYLVVENFELTLMLR